jgi:hypothetical protein
MKRKGPKPRLAVPILKKSQVEAKLAKGKSQVHTRRDKAEDRRKEKDNPTLLTLEENKSRTKMLSNVHNFVITWP